MLENIHKNINGIFSILFFDYGLFTGNIDSSSIIYKECINPETGKFNYIIDKLSPASFIGSLRYAHLECENIMYIHIPNSYISNHYECAINGNKVKEIFKKYGFSLINEYTINPFPFLANSQNSYTLNLRIIEFSNIINK